MEGKVSRSVSEEKLHFTKTLTIGQHMASRRVDPGMLKAAAINGPQLTLAVALWGVKDALELQAQTEDAEYVRRLFDELCDCRLYRVERAAHGLVARLKPVDGSLLNNLECAARSLMREDVEFNTVDGDPTPELLKTAHEAGVACLSLSDYLLTLANMNGEEWDRRANRGEIQELVDQIYKAVDDGQVLDFVGPKFTFGPASRFEDIVGRNAHVAAWVLAMKVKSICELNQFDTAGPLTFLLQDKFVPLPKYDWDRWRAEMESEYDRARRNSEASRQTGPKGSPPKERDLGFINDLMQGPVVPRSPAIMSVFEVSINDLIQGPLAPLPPEDKPLWKHMDQAFTGLLSHMKARPLARLNDGAGGSTE